ncbi:hypothetical protein VR010_04030 [Actinomycetaceae bacterium L2_0104]
MGQFFSTIATAIIVLAVSFVAARARLKPKPVKGSRRLRPPVLVLVIGVLFVVVGAPMILAAFLDPPQDDAVAMRIASIAIFVCGCFFIAWYFIYFVEVANDRVVTRGFDGVVKVIPFDRISSYRLTKDSNGKDILKLESVDGTKININIDMFDVSPLLQYLGNREAQAAAWGGQVEGAPRPEYGSAAISAGDRHSNEQPPAGSDQSPSQPPTAGPIAWQTGDSAWGDDGRNKPDHGPFYNK